MLEKLQAPQWLDRTEPRDGFLWQAFMHLRGSRNEYGIISFREVTQYCDEAGLTCPVQRGRVVRVVIALDNAERDIGAQAGP